MPWFNTEQCIWKSSTNLSCNKTQVLQLDSPALSGTHSSRESLSISTPSSAHCITSITLTKVSDMLVLLRSSLKGPSLPQRLKQVASGPLHTTSSSKQPHFCSPTTMMNLEPMETILKNCSLQNQSQSIQSCSNMMKQSDIKWGRVKTSCLPIERPSLGTLKPLSHQMVLELKG